MLAPNSKSLSQKVLSTAMKPPRCAHTAAGLEDSPECAVGLRLTQVTPLEDQRATRDVAWVLVPATLRL